MLCWDCRSVRSFKAMHSIVFDVTLLQLLQDLCKVLPRPKIVKTRPVWAKGNIWQTRNTWNIPRTAISCTFSPFQSLI